jgi:hypothetical protein
VTPDEREAVIQHHIAYAKLNGCTCEPHATTLEALQAEGRWVWLTPERRAAITALAKGGGNYVLLDHQPECWVMRVGKAIWN